MAKADISGLTRRVARMTDAPVVVTAGAIAIVNEGAEHVALLAQSLVPIRTGDLQESIGIDHSQDGLTAVIGPTEPYGRFVEYGTGQYGPRAGQYPDGTYPIPNAFGIDGLTVHHPGIRPQPYMRPAADVVIPEVRAKLHELATRAAR